MAELTPTPPSLLNARYVAIRTAEAQGLGDRLLEATRDRTPGVRAMLVPFLYRFWHREREKGWVLLQELAGETLRFGGLPNVHAIETFANFSLAVLNGCRGDREQLERLGSIWRDLVERTFASPIARLFGRGLVLRLLARPTAAVLKRQPPYQPLNFAELEVTSSRPDAFRQMWRRGVECLERPETGYQPLVEILRQRDLTFDLYLMLLSERTFIYHGVCVDRRQTVETLERLYEEGCPWFRQSVIYVLFHILGHGADIEDRDLDRYDAIAETFFTSADRKMRTSVASYNFSGHVGWPDIVRERHRPDAEDYLLPRLIRRSVEDGNSDHIEGLFTAIDSIAFAYGNAPLALRFLEHMVAVGGADLEPRVLTSLATARVQDEDLVDAFLEEHPNLARLRPRLEGIQPAIREEDMPTLFDGLTVELIVNSDPFRLRVAAAFRRAAEAKSVPEFLIQILEWMRDEFRAMPR